MNVKNVARNLLRSSLIHWNPHRLGSAYRIGVKGKFEPNDHENQNDEEIYRAKVEHAVLSKAKPPLQPFEHLPRYQPPPLPNDQFLGREIPRYGSFNKYLKEAERTRIRNRKRNLNWKSMDHWWKKHHGEVKYVNIGLDPPSLKLPSNEWRKVRKEISMNRKDRGRERATRLRNLTLDIDATMDAWEDSAHSVHEVHRVAHHYNIFRDLFGHAHFYPTLRMSVEYNTPDGTANPVYYGNELSPGETPTPPDVTYPSTSDKLWSLLLVNLDGNFEDNERELVHWLVGNIKGNDVGSGETLVDYLPPLPIRGTGYHRMVFLLFQQSSTIDFSSERRSSPCDSLSERSFRTRDFYRTFEDSLLPMSLRFFQCRWDEYVREVFQSRLDIAEPIYEFIPNDVDRLGQLKKFPEGKTLTWLKNFMPKEPIYPSGGQFT